MKDYLLSEIKAICDDCVGDCDFCEISYECDSLGIEKYPTHWENIEQRNMIELPCKIYSTDTGYPHIQIVWRGIGGVVIIQFFDDEDEADEFLQKLKGKK